MEDVLKECIDNLFRITPNGYATGECDENNKWCIIHGWCPVLYADAELIDKKVIISV